MDVRVLNLEERWIENDEKGRKGGKNLKSSLTIPEKDKRGPNCSKRDKID